MLQLNISRRGLYVKRLNTEPTQVLSLVFIESRRYEARMTYERFPNFKKFQGKNIFAVDYGTVATGLANFTPGREPFPQPYGRLIYKDDPTLINDLIKVLEDESAEVLIIGLPLHGDGNDTKMSTRIRAFTALLEKEITDIPIIFQDETLSSYEAESRMKTSPRYNFKVDPTQIDALAASIILEDFLKAE
jgi:putative Holliday junction resolvase